MRAENNKVELTGTIITEPEFNHEVFGDGFYNMHLKVDRLSGTADIIPLIISERLINLMINTRALPLMFPVCIVLITNMRKREIVCYYMYSSVKLKKRIRENIQI